jgi:hypothetical protein
MSGKLNSWQSTLRGIKKKFFMYVVQHYFIYRPSDSTVSEDAGIELRTVVIFALTTRLDLASRLSFERINNADMIPDSILSTPDPELTRSRIPDPDSHQRIEVF